MNKILINQIITLREKRKVLEAELGLSSENAHIFSKIEMNLIKQEINSEHAYYTLEKIKHELLFAEDDFIRAYSKIDGNDINDEWNNEFEGLINNDMSKLI
ncbi:hypothetical protein [Helicovermis profundi]|uniref:Uncharacterized protein n=1 Tax=Helicovermis profundi TaxID=3065157 RepID=A0AAU9E4K7_9FIRM|nr:hypothetical protein HLPR_18770 [Clostridia bacterium S502]